LDGTVTAPRKTPQCRFNEKGVRNQYPERHPSQRSGLPRVLGMMSGHDRMGGRCRTNGAPSRLGLMAAFDFRRQLVFNVTHAEYDRIDALKL